MAAEKFGRRMDDHIGAILEGPDQIGRGQRIVDDERHAGALGDLGDRLDVADHAAGIGDQFDEDRLGARADRRLEGREVVGIGPFHGPVEIAVGMIELVDRAAIELGGRDEFVAGLHAAYGRPGIRRRGRRRPRAPPCRLRVRRRAPRARALVGLPMRV